MSEAETTSSPRAGSRRRWVLVGAGVAGAFVLVALGAVGLRHTNTLEFCISCHSMRETVYEEYQGTPHYNNASGVRTTCADCHVPKAFGPLMVAKVLAVADVYHEVVGSIDTPEKFESRRWLMANKVWDRLERTDSGTCRSCHDYDTMDLEAQDKLSRRKHKQAAAEGKTCIACHRGLAHRMPRRPEGASAGGAGGQPAATVAGREPGPARAAVREHGPRGPEQGHPAGRHARRTGEERGHGPGGWRTRRCASAANREGDSCTAQGSLGAGSQSEEKT